MIPRSVRWLAVILPALLVGVLELLSDTALDPYLPFPWDTIVVTVVVAVLAAIFARWTFARMDRLTESLEARNAEVEARAASANALHAVSQAIASLADLDEILRATVDSARDLLSADLALLVLIGADGEPTLRSTSGPESSFDRAGGGPGDEVMRFLRLPPGTAMLAAPLRRGGSTIGTLAVAGPDDAEPRRRRPRDALVARQPGGDRRSRTTGSPPSFARSPSDMNGSASRARSTMASPRSWATSTRNPRPSSRSSRPAGWTRPWARWPN